MHKKVHSSADWTKRTCRQRETFVVAGIAFNRGKFDGIYLARRENGELLYAGKVENGFDPRAEETFRKRAESLKTSTQRNQKAKGNLAQTEATVEYRAYGTGKLRHPSFKGIRDDL
jgi:bifunctional non-homologous end joining protein LigD